MRIFRAVKRSHIWIFDPNCVLQNMKYVVRCLDKTEACIIEIIWSMVTCEYVTFILLIAHCKEKYIL